MIMYRIFLASLLLLPICVKYRKSLFQIKRKEWFAIILAGVFLAAHFGLWFESLNHTTVASSTLLLALQLGIALIRGLIFLKEKIDIRLLIAMLISFIGVVIVGGGNLNLGK